MNGTAFNRDDLNPRYRINTIMYDLLQLANGYFESGADRRVPIAAPALSHLASAFSLILWSIQ